MLIEEDYAARQIRSEDSRRAYVKLLLQNIGKVLKKETGFRKQAGFRQRDEWVAGYTGLEEGRVRQLRSIKTKKPPTEQEAWQIQAAYLALAAWANKTRLWWDRQLMVIDDDEDKEPASRMKPMRLGDYRKKLHPVSLQLSTGVDEVERLPESDDLFEKLWQELVPARGEAETLQGELIRAIGNLGNEYWHNGNLNFLEELSGGDPREGGYDPREAGFFVAFILLLQEHFPEHRDLIHQLWDEPYVRDGSTDAAKVMALMAIEGIVVKWVHEHPDPIPLRGKSGE